MPLCHDISEQDHIRTETPPYLWKVELGRKPGNHPLNPSPGWIFHIILHTPYNHLAKRTSLLLLWACPRALLRVYCHSTNPLLNFASESHLWILCATKKEPTLQQPHQRLNPSRAGLDLYVTKEDRYLRERNMPCFWKEKIKKETNMPVTLVRARQLYLCPLVLLWVCPRSKDNFRSHTNCFLQWGKGEPPWTIC